VNLGPAFFVGLKRVGKSASRNEERTSAAEAAFREALFGTAEAVPLSKTDFFSGL
jgi:hypothetical protein